MPASPDTFTVTCNGIGSIGIDYVDVGNEPDEAVVYAFVWFRPRLPIGTTIWAAGLTPPRGIVLDDVQSRFSPEDGKLRTIIAGPTNEKQRLTITGAPSGGTWTATYNGQTTSALAWNISPPNLQAALEALSNIAPGDVYVSGGIQNERQTVTVNGSPLSGTFCLTYDGETTDPIQRNATPSQVKGALQGLSNIGGIGCSVSGPTGGPWIVEFTGTLAGVNVSQMTAGPRSETQTVELVGPPTAGDFALAFAGQTTTALAYNASAATVQTALEALSNIAPGDVAVTGNPGGPYTMAFAAAWANQDVPNLLLVQRNEVQTVTISGSPTTGNFTLTFDGQTTTPIARNASASTVRKRLEDLANIAPGDVDVQGNPGGPYTVTFQNTLGNYNLPQMTASHTFGGGTTPNIAVSTTLAGIGLAPAATPTSRIVTSKKHAALVGGTTPSVSVATTQIGSTGTPYTVSFIGTLAATDVAQMTASGASLTPSGGVTVETLQTGSSDLGVKLIANTSLIGPLSSLIYDVEIIVPDDGLDEDVNDARTILPFAIAAPTSSGQTIDLATVTKLPHRSELGI